jgi:hypothetical protein
MKVVIECAHNDLKFCVKFLKMHKKRPFFIKSDLFSKFFSPTCAIIRQKET